VVPAPLLTVQPHQIWKKEYTVAEWSSAGFFAYVATLIGDVGGAVNEEDEANNPAQRSSNGSQA